MTNFFDPSLSIVILLALLFPRQGITQTKLDVGGYLQSWYIINQKQDVLHTSMGNLSVLNVDTEQTSGFRIRRARLMAKGNLNDTFSVTTWMEFSTRTPSMLDFYADVKLSEAFTIRAGQIMMPGQSYNTSRRVSSKLPFYERPSITTKASTVMGFDAFRDIGLMAYGQIGKLWYGMQFSNGLGRFQQAESSFSERDFGSGLYGGRVDFEIIDELEVGAHLATNQQRNLVLNDSEPFDINRTSWSIRGSMDGLLIPKFYAQAEYIYFRSNDDNWRVITDPDGKYILSGLYAEAGYRITPGWHILGRYNEMKEEPDQSLVTATESFSNQYTFGITRFIHEDQKEIVRIHLNYSFGETGLRDFDESMLLLTFQLRFIP